MIDLVNRVSPLGVQELHGALPRRLAGWLPSRGRQGDHVLRPLAKRKRGLLFVIELVITSFELVPARQVIADELGRRFVDAHVILKPTEPIREARGLIGAASAIERQAAP